MTRVDFYILPYPSEGCASFACRLIEKVYRMKQKILVWVSSAEEAKKMDDLLWSFRDDSFIPHHIANQEAATSPVIITHDALQSPFEAELLVNLTSEIPNVTRQYTRIAELVSNEPQHQILNRQKYREYQKQGYSLFTHKIS